jgi:hypothetical protein
MLAVSSNGQGNARQISIKTAESVCESLTMLTLAFHKAELQIDPKHTAYMHVNRKI